MNEMRIIAPGEAWEAVERLRIAVDYNRKTESWCASRYEARMEIGWGATPLEAVAQVLERMGEAATAKAEAANV